MWLKYCDTRKLHNSALHVGNPCTTCAWTVAPRVTVTSLRPLFSPRHAKPQVTSLSENPVNPQAQTVHSAKLRNVYVRYSENWYNIHLSIWISFEKPSSSNCLCDAIFLMRLKEKFELDHSWEWKGSNHPVNTARFLCRHGGRLRGFHSTAVVWLCFRSF